MIKLKSATNLNSLLRKNAILKDYLIELSILFDKEITAEDLSLSSEASKIASNISGFEMQFSNKFTIPFSDMYQPRFINYIDNLDAKLSLPIFVFTPHSLICGFMQAQSLRHINFKFPFEINKDGILIFITNDLSNRLSLDFYVSQSGVETVQVEVQGPDWQAIY